MKRIEALLGRMTLEEKVGMVSGSGAWHTTGVARLGIPPIKVTDGPNGARGDGLSGASAVCFPVGSALAASWNEDLIEQVGRALGEEAVSKGAQVLLGPTINIQRTPIGGRNFECYSEDPYHTGRMAIAFVRGVQARGVGASPKHFVCNDTEFERHRISSRVDARTLREIYLLPFEMVVREADPWTVMSAYNRINGTFASSHHELLRDVLKDEWGFQGFVVSDWGASLQTVENANAGLDLEMPGPARTMGEKLLKAVREGRVLEKILDDKVRRLLRVTILSGRLDRPQEVEERSIDLPEHRALARRAAIEGMVLLRNDGILPLDAETCGSVAVIGPNAEVGQIQGGGSSGVKPHYEVHPLQAIRERLGESVLYEPGCATHKYVPSFDVSLLRPAGDLEGRGFALEYFDDLEFGGDPVETRLETRGKISWFGAFASVLAMRRFSARLSAAFTPGKSGTHTFGLLSAGRSRMRIDGEEIIDNWTAQTRGDAFYSFGSTEVRADVDLVAGRECRITIEFQRGEGQLIAGLQFGVLPPLPPDMIERAVRKAAESETAIVVVGTNGEWETEGNDRPDMTLPGRQDELIEAICAANPRTIVVVNAGSPVDTPWLDPVPALLHVSFPGQEFGNALCDVLFGDAEPGGRLATTWPARLEDTPAFGSYPGEDLEMPYDEGLLVGYRWYDTRGIEPRLAFGHGLGYTDFEYGDLDVAPESRVGDSISVGIDVTNAGEREGQEVVQLYVHHDEPRLARPQKELRGFRKIALAAGETRRVDFTLDERSLAFWDPDAKEWSSEAGAFEILVGASSRDIRSRALIERVSR